MTTSYPGGLDAFTNPTSGDDLNTTGVVHSVQHANLNDAVEAIEGELGTNPSAGFSTVGARIAAVESDVAGLPGGDVTVFDAVSYGAVVDGTTNDTAAWQAAINACAAAGGGTVTSSIPGVTVIAGALQDTSNANAQILLPDVHALDDKQMGIVIRGPWQQSACNSVVGATPAPDSGLVFKSTLASGTGAVFGAYGSGTSYLNFTFLNLRLENLTVRTVLNPTITALDLRRVNSVTIENVIVDTGAYSTGALTEPTSSGSYGIRLPKNNNGAHVRLGQVDVFGFYNGIEFSEHTTCETVNVGGCVAAFVATAGHHAAKFERILVGHSKYGIRFTGGTLALDVDQWDTEHAPSGWAMPVYDIDDPSNYGKGFFRWHSVLGGTGDHNVFTKNGGANITTSRVGDAIGGGGATTYVHRDRLVAAAGNTLLALGATPVANSPLVWVNGTIKWPTTDYTISGSSITFNSGLSASDVVAVQYHSTNATYTAATLTSAGVNIVDTFTRADSTSALGSTTTGAKAWTQHSGTWGISANKAYVSNGLTAQTCLATVDAAVASGTVSAIVTTDGSPCTSGIIVRADGSGNNYVVEISVNSASTPKIYKGTAGSYATIATGSSTTVASGSVLSVVLSGSTITVKDDGVTIVSATDSTWNANTRHGMYVTAPAGSGSQARFDDFSIQP